MPLESLSDEEILVRRDMFLSVIRQLRVGGFGAIGGVGIYAAVMSPVVPRNLLVGWVVAMAAGVGCFFLAVRLESPRLRAGAAPRFWPLALISVFTGSCWAMPAVLLHSQPLAEGRWPMVYVFAAAVASNSVIAAAASRLVTAAYIGPLLLLTATFSYLHEADSLRIVLPAGCLFLLVVLLFYSQQAHGTLDDAVRTRHRNDLLAKRLAHDASHDALTGLLNRASLFRSAETFAAQAQADGGGYALVLVDIDGFRNVNDVRGHAVGDLVLQTVAERLRSATPEGALLARLGGDEFVIVAHGLRWRRDAVALAEQVAAIFVEPVSTSERALHIEGSVGVAWSADGTTPATDLLTHADWAMDQAKATDGGRIAIFDEEMHRRFLEHAGLEIAVREGLHAGELEAWAQPVVTLDTYRLVGVELLVRWRRPGIGLVQPGTFMPVAERSALVSEIGRFMLGEAATIIERWQNNPALRAVTVSVNIGARHLHGDDLRRDVEQLVRRHPACRDRLVLELTETEFAENTSAAATTLGGLQAMGVRVAIDDFGTGYSSLAYLQSLPADVIKIDRSFVSAITTDASAAAIVRAVLGLGETFRKRVIAEGIETPAQADALRTMGCSLGQGYLFGKPVPVEELERSMAYQPVEATARR